MFQLVRDFGAERDRGRWLAIQIHIVFPRWYKLGLNEACGP